MQTKRVVSPTDTLLVVDAMTGQEAAGLVKAFNDAGGRLRLRCGGCASRDGQASGLQRPGSHLSAPIPTPAPFALLTWLCCCCVALMLLQWRSRVLC